MLEAGRASTWSRWQYWPQLVDCSGRRDALDKLGSGALPAPRFLSRDPSSSRRHRPQQHFGITQAETASRGRRREAVSPGARQFDDGLDMGTYILQELKTAVPGLKVWGITLTQVTPLSGSAKSRRLPSERVNVPPARRSVLVPTQAASAGQWTPLTQVMPSSGSAKKWRLPEREGERAASETTRVGAHAGSIGKPVALSSATYTGSPDGDA